MTFQVTPLALVASGVRECRPSSNVASAPMPKPSCWWLGCQVRRASSIGAHV
jgi:hypothetical protein